MKNIILPFILLMLVFSISCDSEEDNDEVNAQVAGTWNLTDININSTTTVGGTTTTEQRNGVQFNNPQIVFSENPNEMQATGSFVFEVTTNNNGQISTSTETEDFNNTISNGTWEKNNDTLTLTVSNSETEYIITSLTNSEMRLQYNFEVSGPNVSGDIDGNLTLSK